MTDSWRRYESSRDGRVSVCGKCGKEIPPDAPRYWKKGEKLRCEACGGSEPAGDAPAPQTPGWPKTPCAACGDMHPTQDLITKQMPDWSEVRLCKSCAWLAKAQFGLKTLGLWRPTPKPEVKE